MNNENVGSLTTITVNKDKLLNILKENKERHDAVLQVAVNGYWEAAQLEISKKKVEFVKSTSELKEDV
ncbi:MAG: hypothetical protein AABY22_06160, partial [Nanoarchaeota archaeon]